MRPERTATALTWPWSSHGDRDRRNRGVVEAQRIAVEVVGIAERAGIEHERHGQGGEVEVERALDGGASEADAADVGGAGGDAELVDDLGADGPPRPPGAWDRSSGSPLAADVRSSRSAAWATATAAPTQDSEHGLALAGPGRKRRGWRPST